MLSFLTLFLGLVTGIQPVEAVGGPTAARVEFLLDGRRLAEVTAEPWRAEIDFGAGLEPHRLTAVAYSVTGEELERAEQWVNLPRSRAEASLVRERPGEVSLIWESLENRRPVAVRVQLDGKPLPPLGAGRFRLPEGDDEGLRFLTAELEFDGNVRARVERVIGGRFGAETTVEMTAVAVVGDGAEALEPQAVEGLLRKHGRPVPVVAVEREGWELLVVTEPGAVPGLGGLGRQLDRRGGRRDAELRLPAGAEVRFLSPQPGRTAKREVPIELFPISNPFSGADGDLPHLITHVDLRQPTGVLHLADAVAVAGVQAAAGNRPRAVLLILGEERADASRFSPAAVQDYLRSLRVPLVVWSTGPALVRTISEGRRPISVGTRWGRAQDVSSVGRLEAAALAVARLLRSQSIVWVEGAHLPQRIELAPGSHGLSLAGS